MLNFFGGYKLDLNFLNLFFFKGSSPSKYSLKYFLLIFLLFNFLSAQTEAGKEGSFTKQELKFLEGEFTLIAEARNYHGIKIDQSRSIPIKTYKLEQNQSLDERNSRRVTQALLYLKNEKFQNFEEILFDIILENHYTELAGEAAFYLGEHELDKKTKAGNEKALLYFLYVVNNHYNSGKGLAALFGLAKTLMNLGYYQEGEKVLQEVLDAAEGLEGGELLKEANEYLIFYWGERAKYFYSTGGTNLAKGYIERIKEIRKEITTKGRA